MNGETLGERAERLAQDVMQPDYLSPTRHEVAAALRAIAAENDALRRARDEARQDDHQWDATDAAHPAWWRGNDRGVEAVVQIINDQLDGKPHGTFGSPTLTAVCKRLSSALAEAREQGRREGIDVAAAWHINEAERLSKDDQAEPHWILHHQSDASSIRALSAKEDGV